jgi:hypothetical protein
LSFFVYQKKAAICSRFLLEQKSRMLRAIFVPLGTGGYRFFHQLAAFPFRVPERPRKESIGQQAQRKNDAARIAPPFGETRWEAG